MTLDIRPLNKRGCCQPLAVKGMATRLCARITTEAMTDTMLAKITLGEVPETWDGVELREWMYECAGRNRARMDGKRKRDYSNTMFITSL